MGFKVITKTLVGSGANQLTTTHIPARWAIVFNVTANGPLTVGDKNISATNYAFAVAPAAASPPIGPFDGAALNLADLWFIGTAGNVIRVAYVS